MSELGEHLIRAFRKLARVEGLTPERIAASEEIAPLSAVPRARILKETLAVTRVLRRGNQFGKLRAALLAGITIIGDTFLVEAERAGVLLPADATVASFPRLLHSLAADAARSSDPSWAILHRRLKTYTAFHALVGATSRATHRAQRLLKDRPRRELKTALALAGLSFLRVHFRLDTPPEISRLLDELETPEDGASAVSSLVAIANEHRPLDSYDLSFPSHGTKMQVVRELMEYGKAAAEEFEIGKYIALFRYSLESLPGPVPVFRLTPPSAQFEHALRLGYIRSQLDVSAAPLVAITKGASPDRSFLGAAERFAEEHGTRLGQVVEEPPGYPRLRFSMPAIPKLFERMRESLLYEDAVYLEELAESFLVPLRYKNDPEIRLAEHLDFPTFLSIWRYLRFVAMVEVALLRKNCTSDPALLLNSIVRVTHEESLMEFLAGLGLRREQAMEFLQMVSADAGKRGYLDLQFRPFLRIERARLRREGKLTPPEVLYMPALLCTSNVVRNVQSANQVRLGANARAFVDAAAQMIRARFPNVVTNRPIKGRGCTDIDVAVLAGSGLYLFECKHSLFPTGPHELRDIWEEIEKGVRQLQVAEGILADPRRRQAYLAGWFTGTRAQDTRSLQVRGCVLCSHKIFSGLHHRGYPIRDFGSLSRLCGDGVVGLGRVTEAGEQVIRRYRIIRGAEATAQDLDDYLSPTSTYFKTFATFMHPVTRIKSLSHAIIARETFVYEVDLRDWDAYLQSLGCTREPDSGHHVKVPDEKGPLGVE